MTSRRLVTSASNTAVSSRSLLTPGSSVSPRYSPGRHSLARSRPRPVMAALKSVRWPLPRTIGARSSCSVAVPSRPLAAHRRSP